MSDCENSIRVYTQHLTFDIEEDLSRLLPTLKNDIVLVEPHWLELLQVVEVEGILTILEKRYLLDGVSVQETSQLNFKRRRQHFKEVADVLLGWTCLANVLLKVDKKAINQFRSDIEFLVKLVNLTDPFFICLAWASKFAEKRGQFTELGDKDSHSEDDNEENPAQLKATWLSYVAIAYCSNGYNRPVDGSDPLCG